MTKVVHVAMLVGLRLSSRNMRTKLSFPESSLHALVRQMNVAHVHSPFAFLLIVAVVSQLLWEPSSLLSNWALGFQRTGIGPKSPFLRHRLFLADSSALGHMPVNKNTAPVGPYILKLEPSSFSRLLYSCIYLALRARNLPIFNHDP